MRKGTYRCLYAIMTGAWLLGLFLGGEAVIGVSLESGGSGYRFGGGTAPWALALSALSGAVYSLAIRKAPASTHTPFTSRPRRFAAFWLDFVFAGPAIGALVGIIPASVESTRLGTLTWSFVRNTSVWSDGLATAAGMTLGGAGLLGYFAVPLFLGRPTLGAGVMGYTVIPLGSGLTWRQCILRTLAGFLAVAAAGLFLLTGRWRRKDPLWLDTISGTQTVHLD